jgi:hypothetical protein
VRNRIRQLVREELSRLQEQSVRVGGREEYVKANDTPSGVKVTVKGRDGHMARALLGSGEAKELADALQQMS